MATTRRKSSITEETDNLFLYYYPYSFYSQKVVMVLMEKNIPYTGKLVNIHSGEQFTERFLALNPRGEVPVLVDDVRVIVDSAAIIDYLEDNFNSSVCLRPKDPEIRARVEYLNNELSSIKVEAMTFGSGIFTVEDLQSNPKPPYNTKQTRAQMAEIVSHRTAILRTEAKRFPQYKEALLAKLHDLQKEMPLMKKRTEFEELLLRVEHVLDECEAELITHKNPKWWLASPDLSIADISLGVLLFRLWEIGFESRMWENNRPNIAAYFARIQRVKSFNLATSMKVDVAIPNIFKNPITYAVIGGGLAIAAGYAWLKSNKSPSLAGFFGIFGSSSPASALASSCSSCSQKYVLALDATELAVFTPLRLNN